MDAIHPADSVSQAENSDNGFSEVFKSAPEKIAPEDMGRQICDCLVAGFWAMICDSKCSTPSNHAPADCNAVRVEASLFELLGTASTALANTSGPDKSMVESETEILLMVVAKLFPFW